MPIDAAHARADAPSLSRRQWLGGALSAVAAVTAGSWNQCGMARQKPPAADDQGWIDAHVHVWTPDTLTYPLAAGFRREEMRPASFTPDELLAQARPQGVSRVVLVQMSFYGFDQRYLLDCLAAYPGVFSGIAVIDDDAADPAVQMRRLAASGVRGFRIYPRNRAVADWLSGAGAKAMWQTGADEHLAMCCLVNPGELPAVDQMCQRFPETPVVIDHLARIGMDGTIREADVTALCRLARWKQTYVKVSAFYALGARQPPYRDLVPVVRRVVEAFGAQRLMWGTDCPYQVQEQTYADSLAFIQQTLDFLTPAARQALLRDTARGLFFAGS